jgi:predicted GNAT family acetyltransferase
MFLARRSRESCAVRDQANSHWIQFEERAEFGAAELVLPLGSTPASRA